MDDERYSIVDVEEESSSQNTIRDHELNLVAEDTGQGHRLLQNYYRMRSSAEVPAANRFKATSYAFSVKLKKGIRAAEDGFNLLAEDDGLILMEN